MSDRAVDDPDFTLYLGDALETLRELPDESVSCVVTSPPYWGLRDYGTGSWEGGDEDCDHRQETRHQAQGATSARAGRSIIEDQRNENFRDVCGKCGSIRVDQQLGLEATPEEYVERMTAVFREVRRVLRSDGTCWLNIGDSYASSSTYNTTNTLHTEAGWKQDADRRPNNYNVPGLKPKDLVGIPWRLAFALQADGWYLRSDIIWSKPNPMPESVTDRPTKAHEYLFLLSKSPRYWFDQEAVREKAECAAEANGTAPVGRNVRSVWEIATQPYPEAHFATFPEELARRCILAGCPEWVCGTCGKARERIVDRESTQHRANWSGESRGNGVVSGGGHVGRHGAFASRTETVGWSDCGHDNYQPGVVLDPFMGSGTVALVARKHGRRSIGIELSEEYAKLAARRLSQLSLLAGVNSDE